MANEVSAFPVVGLWYWSHQHSLYSVRTNRRGRHEN